MKKTRPLIKKGAILEKEQLKQYLEKIASDIEVGKKSDKRTYPIGRIEEDFLWINKTYKKLNEDTKQSRNIHPAGEWILDNYYILEETIKIIKKQLSKKRYKNLPAVENGSYKGYARILMLSCEIVSYTDGKLDSESIKEYIQAYQKEQMLTMEEIWNIGLFIQIALIDQARIICEKIYSSQIQKNRAENIIENCIEKEKGEAKSVEKIPNKLEEVQNKYPFLEHLSYLLRKYGKKSKYFYLVLEEQVKKMGTTLDEVITKEHFDIAIKKLSMKNVITSLKEISRIDFLEIFEDINGVEEILKKDPAKIYENMDYETKAYYRNAIKALSEKTKLSEIYVAQKALELSQEADILKKDGHIGYYLIDDGEKKLYKKLTGKEKKKLSNNKKAKIYIFTVYFTTLILVILLGKIWYTNTKSVLSTALFILIYEVPIQTAVVQILQYFIVKKVPKKHIPKLEIDNIKKEDTTLVVIPTIIESKDRVDEIMHNLECYYLSNKMENIHFALLGDCTSSKKEEEKQDEEVIKEGIRQADILNKKYPDKDMPKFIFFYRKRQWVQSEECYQGWERKRGLLNQLNEYLLMNIPNPFLANTLEGFLQNNNYKKVPKIKYIITLDADTDLPFDTAKKLVGAMSHILNKPVLNKEETLVVAGYAIMQPRVGVDLEISNKTTFCKLFAGSGGTDIYSNAISDVYQDSFSEGIFTGKGIYDLEVFSKVLSQKIPENTVLSHDLLEGSYLRCGLVSDILLMDGYPSSYQSYKKRLHRWIRGDFQITSWLFSKVYDKNNNKIKNPLNCLSKYKILDNLLRGSSHLFIYLGIIVFLIQKALKKDVSGAICISFFCLLIPMILDILEYVLHEKSNNAKQRNFTSIFSGIKGSFLRGIISILILPDKAYLEIDAIIRTIYRKFVSKKHLLEWTTSQEAEKENQNIYKNMMPNVISSIIMGIFSIIFLKNGSFIYSLFCLVLAILWIASVKIMNNISKENKEKQYDEILSEDKIQYLNEISKRTWKYFKENMNKQTNFLPPDNFQEDRKEQFVYRTSPTNIGLGLISTVASYDLKYENLKDTIQRLKSTLKVVLDLKKWNGHLYNWYDIKTLEPLKPLYVSSVDSGNFVGYLYVVKQFLLEVVNSKEVEEIKKEIENLIYEISKLIENTDFSKLYSEKNKLFSIGFGVEENKLTDSYYDLLASEARQTSFIAIAKGDVPSKHWNHLGRALTRLNGYKGLISWAGTSFEYLMPNIVMPSYKASLLQESISFSVMSQKEYAKKLNIPWGISESAYNLKDLDGNYQYKSFGIPWLGLKRGLADEIVVCPYGSILALEKAPNDVLQNLKKLEKCGMFGKYGFYESIDYTPGRLSKAKSFEVVKTYMAHHQGLIFIAIANYMNNNKMKKRFFKNPELEGYKVLLEERMPEKVLMTKEEKEKIEKIKYKNYESYIEKTYTKIEGRLQNCNVIGNRQYTVVMNQKAEGYSKYKNIQITRYKEENSDQKQGIIFYFKDIKNNNIWTSIYNENDSEYKVTFAPDKSKITKKYKNVETTIETIVVPNNPVEIRKITLKNTGDVDLDIEISSYLEPVLSGKMQDEAHSAFNNLFLNYEWIQNDKCILVNRNLRDENEEKSYLATTFLSDDNIENFEYEIDKEKFVGRDNLGIPESVISSYPLSNKMGLTTAPIIAIRKSIKLKAKSEVNSYFILSVESSREDTLKNLEEYMSKENIERVFPLARTQIEAQNRYLDIRAGKIVTYQKLLSYMIFQNPAKSLIKTDISHKMPIDHLWRFGISGDFPILVVLVQNIGQMDLVKECLDAYRFSNMHNIQMELVVVIEKIKPEKQIRNKIEDMISELNLEEKKQKRGGIFVISNIDKDIRQTFILRSSVVLDAKAGDMNTQILEMEEEILESKKDKSRKGKIYLQTEKEKSPTIPDLEYDNGYGGFADEGKQYFIKVNKENKTPNIWCNVIANDKFGTVVSESMGGYTWYRNSRLNRITNWSNDFICDPPSEAIYLKDIEKGEAWSVGLNPMPDNNDYYIMHGQGFSVYKHNSDGIEQTNTVFIPKDENVKLNILKLRNTTPRKKKISIYYYLKPVLGESFSKNNGKITNEFNKESNVMLLKNIGNEEFTNYAFVSSSKTISSYTASFKNFIGNKNIQSPESIYYEQLDNENAFGNTNAMVIKIDIEIESYEEKEISILLGAGENRQSCIELARKYKDVDVAKNSLEEVKRFWREKLQTIQVKTPIRQIDILLNSWLIYQTYSSRMLARTGFYQSGGAYGFRDQLQDALSMKYIDSNILRRQILKQAKHQFIQGDVEHWWHEETRRGIRSRFSDDMLWLVYAVEDYISFTGDYSILDIEVSYVLGDVLEDGQNERYDEYLESDKKESIYKHCTRAINRAINLGDKNLPKIGTGDWNDGFNKVGEKGQGQSVWLGFFLYYVLENFIPICERQKENKKDEDKEIQGQIDMIKDVLKTLKNALNEVAWDGKWYKRAFTDENEEIGSIKNDEGKIDSISQSWSVISKAGDNDKKYIAMESLEEYLVDKENGIIKLLNPPFKDSDINPGYIKSYLPGTRENGGQYTHAAIWAIIAQTMLGFGNKAVEMYKMINPIEHSSTKEAIEKYKVEPYVIAADVYGEGNLIGRGGWTWYTGSSSWYYIAGICHILGLTIKDNKLSINPCISSSWDQYEIRYKYGRSIYNIYVHNPNHKQTGIEKMEVNGVEIPEKEIKLDENGGIYNINVEM